MRTVFRSGGRVETPGPTPQVLLVSSFVRPHPGGVEDFVDSSRAFLEERGFRARVLACRLPGMDTSADVVIPTRFVGASSWPLPTGGLRTLWREVSAADVVLANNARHLLPALAVILSGIRGRAAFMVVHGSGAGPYGGPRAFAVARSVFERSIGRLALRLSHAVSVSRAGVEGVSRLYGVHATYLPYPLRGPAPRASAVELEPDEPMRVVWVGRLFPEKDPLLAVDAVDVLRRRRSAELHVYGDGHLRRDLERLAGQRPWLTVHGAKPWEEVQEAQAGAHACLATSVADNVQVAVLEALTRGIPTVSTRVGDALSYYASRPLQAMCVPARDPAATAEALFDLASSYGRYRREFAGNADILRDRHLGVGEALVALVSEALPGRATLHQSPPVG